MTTQTEDRTAPTEWNRRLREQLRWHWENQLRPRLEGLTDQEYLSEPVADCWTVRPRGEAGPAYAGAVTAGSGDFAIDFAFPMPEPAPFTSIAWRLSHVIVGVLGQRNADHFAGPACSYQTHAYAGTAAEALEQLDAAYSRWMAGVASLDESGLEGPCGESEGPFAQAPMADLVLHIHREIIHHGAEIALLRDLYLPRHH
ncbi:DinB family protein [Arthrobacter rhombi]|uniref:DinB family protein n=1 Tax=Arthrobacter rhombi TaxID=71253 RepID=UPI000B351755|nr:DinB family protein [Arthrobacter rhombi]